MSVVFLGFGSNKGDRLGYLRKAVGSVSVMPGVVVKRVSSVYETQPRGLEEQPNFLNAALVAETGLPAADLADSLKALEHSLGRTGSVRWGPREIDIDMLFYDKMVLESVSLTIPHPELHKRKFVLEPLRELDPDFVHPLLGASVDVLHANCPDTGWVRKTSMKLTQSE